jgi:Ras-related GTP-binding protein C/D
VLVYVVDAQDEPYQDAMLRLVKTIQVARNVNPNIAFEVFVHKIDGELFLTDEQKIDCQQEVEAVQSSSYPHTHFFNITTTTNTSNNTSTSPTQVQQTALDELSDVGLGDSVHLNFHLTSIYDHTIFEAFSKVG